MRPLRSVLMAFAERPGVAGALVVSDDGLVVESALGDERDPDEVAALAASAGRALAALSRAFGAGVPIQTVVDAESEVIILQRLPTGGTLVALAHPDADLDTLMYDLRRHAPALVSLL
jgi:predicted regulator of Ras-like GTPase activity (Roadblock/LC7/MglB family)